MLYTKKELLGKRFLLVEENFKLFNKNNWQMQYAEFTECN